MGLLDCASGASLWRGYDYYKEKRVNSLTETEEYCYQALVSGNAKAPYNVEIDVNHPRKSRCNCPHAYGKRIVCKHMVAVYFAAYPVEATKFYSEYVKSQEEEEKREEELYDRVCQYVWQMKKSELQQALIEMLSDGPEWQYDRFIREHDLDEY